MIILCHYYFIQKSYNLISLEGLSRQIYPICCTYMQEVDRKKLKSRQKKVNSNLEKSVNLIHLGVDNVSPSVNKN